MALLQIWRGMMHPYDKDGNEVPTSDWIEHYMPPSRADKLLIRLGFKVRIGKFKPEGFIAPMMFYWIWCSNHEKYKATYPHGYKEVLVCNECEKERFRSNIVRNLN
jgi:hypothetical protein